MTNAIATPAKQTLCFEIQVKCIDTKRIINRRRVSNQTTPLQRHDMARRMVATHSDPRDCFVVEIEKFVGEDFVRGGVVRDKYDFCY
jgi:hypothetical protein